MSLIHTIAAEFAAGIENDDATDLSVQDYIETALGQFAEKVLEDGDGLRAALAEYRRVEGAR